MRTVEGLAEPVVYDVIAAAVNHEMKGAVLGQMRDGLPYTARPLHAKTIEMQGDNPAWKVAVQTPIAYCRTFATVGEIVDVTTGPVAYTINERGRKLALPLLGHCLDVSLKEEPSLSDFHGPTATNRESGIRACQRRLQIMRLLRTNDGARTSITDVAAQLETSISVTGTVVEDLSRFGILQSESSGRGKPTVTFTPNCDLTKVKLRTDVGSPLLFDVMNVLRQHFTVSEQPIDNAQIVAELIATRGYAVDEDQLTKKVSNMTNQLTRVRSVLKAHRDRKDKHARGVVWATHEQLATMANLLQAVDGIQKPTTSYLQDGHDKLEVILGDTESLNHLITKARRDSQGLRRLPENRLANEGAVAEVLAHSTEPKGVRDVQVALLDKGINLDRHTVRSYLNNCVSLGKVATHRSKEGEKYSIATDE